MTGSPLPAPVLRAVDANGAPIPGALLQFYLTGTTTPTPVYTDKTLGTVLANPVVADAGGLFPPMFVDPSITYRCQLLNAASAVIQDVDPVAAPVNIAANSVTSAMLQAGVAVANIGYTPLNRAGDTASNLLLTATSLSANSAGYLGAPINEQDAAYTFALSDAGKMVRGNSASAMAWTIPLAAPVAYPVGTAIVARNVGAGAVTITRTSGVTLYLAGASTSKDVALASWGMATLIMEASNSWVISGVGIS